MAPSRNSMLLTKPVTRARTCTCSTASKRPVNSSQSVTTRLLGCATVTGGGGGAAVSVFWPQPASSSAIRLRERLAVTPEERPNIRNLLKANLPETTCRDHRTYQGTIKGKDLAQFRCVLDDMTGKMTESLSA